MFSREELELVASLCQQHDVVCITDEVYQWLVFDGFQHISIGEPSRPGRPVPPDLCGREAWRAAIHGVAESRTRLSN